MPWISRISSGVMFRKQETFFLIVMYLEQIGQLLSSLLLRPLIWGPQSSYALIQGQFQVNKTAEAINWNGPEVTQYYICHPDKNMNYTSYNVHCYLLPVKHLDVQKFCSWNVISVYSVKTLEWKDPLTHTVGNISNILVTLRIWIWVLIWTTI